MKLECFKFYSRYSHTEAISSTKICLLNEYHRATHVMGRATEVTEPTTYMQRFQNRGFEQTRFRKQLLKYGSCANKTPVMLTQAQNVFSVIDCFAGKGLSLALCSDLLSHGRCWWWLGPCGLRLGLNPKQGRDLAPL
ncbi:hypothetical protein L3X38_018632 [Prunus dulcis]|uniref:Uncharacterized protein n=1 Tax=Prunus dulcis TaxID=3755 RepID=A0AAD4W9E9_PRUDU|nr:hypothetical protein L3X38_018632 [Prunus dulcis]